MSPLQQLQSIINKRYVSEDGDEYGMELKPGLSDERIDELAARLPTGELPADIRELLRFASGFAVDGLEGVTFDGIGDFGFEEVFPYSVQLAGDGFGNFWILDVDGEGRWNNVFYVCHDPAVVVLHSKDLGEFISHLDEYGEKGAASTLDHIHEIAVMDIWQNDHGFIAIADARASPDAALSGFASGLPDHFVIADLRNKPNGEGFAWGRFGPDIDNAVRHGSELIWGFETRTGKTRQAKPEQQKKKGFFSKLFGR